jgi:hypothetical protein
MPNQIEIQPISAFDAEREKNIRLEQIFLPHNRSNRERLAAASDDGFQRFIHYTSAEAALKIISKKTLWMRSLACMADYSEAAHGVGLLEKYFSVNEKKTRFISVFDSVTEGAAQEAIRLFAFWWDAGIIQHRTFIASLSEHKDHEDRFGRLSMWRAFGGNSARVGIVLRAPKVSKAATALNLLFAPVTYRDSVDDTLTKTVENISSEVEFLKTLSKESLVGWITHMLLVVVTCTKHPAFEEEQEWRVVYNPDLRGSPLVSKSIEVIAGLPQVVHHLQLDENIDPALADLDLARIFDRMIIGPTQYPMTLVEAFSTKLVEMKFPDLQGKIVISHIPLRT